MDVYKYISGVSGIPSLLGWNNDKTPQISHKSEIYSFCFILAKWRSILFSRKKGLKIQKGQSETINRRTDNTMSKRKKRQTKNDL